MYKITDISHKKNIQKLRNILTQTNGRNKIKKKKKRIYASKLIKGTGAMGRGK